MTDSSRRPRAPRPASGSKPLPTIERFALTLALGALGASTAAGCHREPFCMNPGAVDTRDGDPSRAGWWSRVSRLIACDVGPTSVGNTTPRDNVLPPAGAIAITQPEPPSVPTPPSPVQPEGGPAVTSPAPVLTQGGARAVSPHPTRTGRVTRVSSHH